MPKGIYKHKPCSEEHKRKLSEANKWQRNEKHSCWKGKKVKYRGNHMWVGRQLGKPTKCEHCKKDGLTGHQIHWANISRKYKRILTDWIRLCAKCHGEYDAQNRRQLVL